MIITVKDIKNIAPKANSTIAEGFVKYFNQYAEKYEITTYLRVCHFVAQAAWESNYFKTLKEYGSGAEYEGRKDLGNIHKGDGKKYKGRGIFQITGYDNYSRMSKLLGIDLLNQPELAETPEISVLTAMEFWKFRKLNKYADADDIEEVTHKINGGKKGLPERTTLLEICKNTFKKEEIMTQGNPSWLTIAEKYVGTKEYPGKDINPIIKKWFVDSGHKEITDDATAWCAAAMNGILAEAGIKGTGSLAARSFLNWGYELTQPKKGCIVVFKRGNSTWQGHVAFYISETKDKIKVLGGNQSDSYGYASYSKSNLLGYRWPDQVDVKIPDTNESLIKQYQTKLIALGYTEVGNPDGKIGKFTKSGISLFIKDWNERNPNDVISINTDGFTYELMHAIDIASPRTMSQERTTATISDLRKGGSEIIKGTDLQKIGSGAVIVGTAAEGIQRTVDTLSQAGETADQVNNAIGPLQSLFENLANWWWVPVLIIALFLLWQAFKIAKSRLEDHRSGNTRVINLSDKVNEVDDTQG